jgi:two-component sensor histidine kinase
MEISIYEKKQRWKLFLFFMAILIGAGSLIYTNRLVNALSDQERGKVELWAEAIKILISAETNGTDLSFPLTVMMNNSTIPVILTDSIGEVITHKNLDTIRVNNPVYLTRQLDKMRIANDSIPIDLGDGDMNFIFYGTSIMLNRLKYFPVVQLVVIMLFIFVAYLAFSSSRKAEQNKVWIGLSKETAHQLGTPTSSLNAWVELLKSRPEVSDIAAEIEKDALRLEKITERFSKVGSKPVLSETNLINVLHDSITYLKSRSSNQVSFHFSFPENEVILPLNESLFQWVIENICKNAMDAMDGKGEITISVEEQSQNVILDISDTGKGIPKSKFKTIFQPGYTTKKRGWGLGLSLSKRIVEEYHSGRIFILNSEQNKGTTLRMVLRR